MLYIKVSTRCPLLNFKRHLSTFFVTLFNADVDPDVSRTSPPLLLIMKTRYEEVVRSTAELVAKWQCVGFTHGVLNTDNMSLLGLTIDYGPYGFMDFFDPKFVPNGSDSGGRYSYEKQPEVRRAVTEKKKTCA